MRSNEPWPTLDLEHAIPTVAADNAALRRCLEPAPSSFGPYFDFLKSFELGIEVLRQRKNTQGEPFGL